MVLSGSLLYTDTATLCWDISFVEKQILSDTAAVDQSYTTAWKSLQLTENVQFFLRLEGYRQN